MSTANAQNNNQHDGPNNGQEGEPVDMTPKSTRKKAPLTTAAGTTGGGAPRRRSSSMSPPAGSPGSGQSGDVVVDVGALSPVILNGWRAYVQRTHTRPARVKQTVYDQQSSMDQRRYNRARKAHHRGLAEFETRDMRLAHKQINSRVEGAEGSNIVARPGLVLDGPPLVGKSTILLRWGADFEIEEREIHNCGWDARTRAGGALFIPCVFVILGDDDGPKGLCQKILTFMGEPFAKSDTHSQLTSRLSEVIPKCGVRVIMIDQMQNLKMSNRSSQQVITHLKELMDALPVTIIGAGVDMASTGFLSEGHGRNNYAVSQVAHRFGVYRIQHTDTSTPEGRQDWDALIAAVEDHLVLLKHRPGDLTRLSDYLFGRTGGVTGHLMDLLRRGANEAVGGSERVTKTLLDDVSLAPGAVDIRASAAALAQTDADAAIRGRATAAAEKSIRKNNR